MKIKQINDTALSFLKESIADEVKIIRARKNGDSWIVVAEIFEDSAFIKSIGLNTNVKDRYFYEVEVDNDLEIIGYNRLEGVEEA